jgi:hypothetical protein
MWLGMSARHLSVLVIAAQPAGTAALIEALADAGHLAIGTCDATLALASAASMRLDVIVVEKTEGAPDLARLRTSAPRSALLCLDARAASSAEFDVTVCDSAPAPEIVGAIECAAQISRASRREMACVDTATALEPPAGVLAPEVPYGSTRSARTGGTGAGEPIVGKPVSPASRWASSAA